MAKRTGNTIEAAGALGKHLAKHKIASGQDFWQSGKAGFSWGQQGIPSAMDAVSDISAEDASSIGATLNRITIEVVRRLTTVRIESKREMSDDMCTYVPSHILHCEKRGGRMIFAARRYFPVIVLLLSSARSGVPQGAPYR
jgi:hypothetical protein